MHLAYECTRVLKLNVQIESIAAYGRNLLVGTKQGHLLMYSVSTDELDPKNGIGLLRYNKTFSKKPIQQLAVIPDYEILICLTDNLINIHDIKAANFTPIPNDSLQNTKGATIFTLYIQRQKTMTGEIAIMIRMCVAVKKKLQFYYWSKQGFQQLSPEFSVPDVPRTIAWCQESICVAFKGDSTYSLYTIDGKLTELFPSGSAPPNAIRFNDTTFVLGKGTHSVAVTHDGGTVQTQPLNWSEVPRDLSDIPRDLVADPPYLVALKASTVEVRALESSGLVQKLNVEDPHLIVQCHSGLVYVASRTFVWCLRNVSWSRQIHDLLDDKNFHLALKIADVSDEPEDEKLQLINQIQTLYAYDLFKNKKFKESMNLFLVAKTDPCKVIKLFPNLLPQESRNTGEPIMVKLEGNEWVEGVHALIYYLTHARLNVNLGVTATDNCIGKGQASTQKLLQIIDTTLLKCYIETNDTRVAPLLRLNHCHLEETEKTLKKYNKQYLDELIILYQYKGLHKKALELLQKFSDQDSVLKGPQKTVHYLQRLGGENIELIFEFADWVLKKYPEEGLAIFTEDTPEVEGLPRPKVLDYILRRHRDIALPYLEHIVKNWNDDSPICHNALVNQYQERYNRLISEKKTEEAQQWKAKLLKFLQESTLYTPETVLVHLPLDGLFEERAVVLKRLGRHEQALFLYVAMLADVESALSYCADIYEENTPGADEVYFLLVKLLLSPPESWLKGSQTSIKNVEPDLETALKILEEHCTKIKPLQALEVLPDTLPLIRIRRFLEGSLQKELSDRRKMQVLRGLVYAEHLQVQEQRILFESQSIKLTEFNVCSVCKKRFGNQSAFARFPGGSIVHYSCQDRRA